MNRFNVKKTISIVAVALVLLIFLDYGFSVYCYNNIFGKRLETYEPTSLKLSDFEGLNATHYEFPSDKGQMLSGYLYSTGSEPKGIVVIAHGFGSGHNFYMEAANFFAQNGYDTFAYDVTGNDESEGEAIGGIPQGVIDLDNAISFVEDSGNFPDVPIMLFGHSWGAYSACSVLEYHPEVAAVIAISGCNKSSDVFEVGAKEQLGPFTALMMPCIRLHERIKFGKYAKSTAMKGFKSSDTRVMVVHSEDDNVVGISYGYDIYYDKYKDDARFSFMKLKDKGHSYVFNDMTYIDEFNAGFDKWLETLDYDYSASENQDRFIADKADYIHKNLDRNRWSNKLDTGMFQDFLAFYNDEDDMKSARITAGWMQVVFGPCVGGIVAE